MYTAKGQLDRDALIRQHVPLVRRIALHMIAKLPPNVELDDLIQVGMIGLAEALSRFESEQGVQLILSPASEFAVPCLMSYAKATG